MASQVHCQGAAMADGFRSAVSRLSPPVPQDPRSQPQQSDVFISENSGNQPLNAGPYQYEGSVSSYAYRGDGHHLQYHPLPPPDSAAPEERHHLAPVAATDGGYESPASMGAPPNVYLIPPPTTTSSLSLSALQPVYPVATHDSSEVEALACSTVTELSSLPPYQYEDPTFDETSLPPVSRYSSEGTDILSQSVRYALGGEAAGCGDVALDVSHPVCLSSSSPSEDPSLRSNANWHTASYGGVAEEFSDHTGLHG